MALGKNLKVGIIGVGRVGSWILKELLQNENVVKISLVDRYYDNLEDTIEWAYFYGKSYKPIENCRYDVETLKDCDAIIYSPGFGKTPVEFEEFDSQRLEILIDKYIDFLKNARNKYQEEQKIQLRKDDYLQLLRTFGPLLQEEEYDKLSKHNDFDELKKRILEGWSRYSQNSTKSLPQEVFEPSEKDGLKQGIPDVVFEEYMDHCLDCGLEFLDENESKEKLGGQFEVYKMLRGIKGMGYRSVRFLPSGIGPTIELADRLKGCENSLLMVVSNPVDYLAEIIYRRLGKESAKRIMGVNYCDSKRHTSLRRVQKREIDAYNLADVEFLAWMWSTHDRNAVLDPRLIMKEDTMLDDALINAMPTIRNEEQRIWKQVTSYPAMKGAKSYPQIGEATSELIDKYAADEVVPSSVHVRLSDFAGFDYLIDSNTDKGCFVSIPCKIINAGTKKNPRYEIEIWLQ